MLSVDNYKIKTWSEKFPDYKVDLATFKIHTSWKDFFEQESKKEYFREISEFLTLALTTTKGNIQIYPYPDIVFSALNTTPSNKLKVVILGQDPYPKDDIIEEKHIPQAMGLSFSVPVGIAIPSSLNNIYKNQLKYNNIMYMPKHGNLISWAYQGCLMLNTALTVQHGYPNSHANYWQEFSDNLIKYISETNENIVFLLWGAPALQKLKLIDENKHKIIISSHPSGLSNTKQLKQYKSFDDTDHFGEANKYLKEKGKSTIIWQIS